VALSYYRTELQRQLAFLQCSNTFSIAGKLGGGKLGKHWYPFVLPEDCVAENLFPEIRDSVQEYYKKHRVTWHRAHAHLLSSQVCCANFLEPFAFRPLGLKKLLEPVLGPIKEMLPIGSDPERLIAYEFVGGGNYLNEWKSGVPTPGANCTSVDAAVRFTRPNGDVEAVLIEWKYTESYGSPDKEDPANEERRRRYSGITFDPSGPVRSDLGIEIDDLFGDPIYELYRQRMLAFQIEKHGELEAKQVHNLLIAPFGNSAFRVLRNPALSRFGDDVVTVMMSILTEPDLFVFSSAESLFAHARSVVSENWSLGNWYCYMADRYGFGTHK
jgi:hypothetical protein